MERFWDGEQWTQHRQRRGTARPPTSVNPAARVDKPKERSGVLRAVIILLLVFGGIAIISGGLGSSSGRSGGSGGSDSPQAVSAWVMCQQFIEDQLKAPSTAEYPSGYRDYTTKLSSTRFRVDAYVDAENSFGATIRTNFNCTVEYQGSDRWRLENLTIDE